MNAERLDGSSQPALTPHRAKMQLDSSTMTTDKLRRCKHINNLGLKYFTLNFSFSPLVLKQHHTLATLPVSIANPPLQSYLSNEA